MKAEVKNLSNEKDFSHIIDYPPVLLHYSLFTVHYSFFVIHLIRLRHLLLKEKDVNSMIGGSERDFR